MTDKVPDGFSADLMREWLDPSKDLAEVSREAVEKLPEYLDQYMQVRHGEIWQPVLEPFRELHRKLETAVETLPAEQAASQIIQAYMAMVKTFTTATSALMSLRYGSEDPSE